MGVVRFVGSMALNDFLKDLPHGPEFQFIHEITSMEPGNKAEGTYLISGEEEFLKGHFPTHSIWPGVVMIEAIAQLGGVLAQSDPTEDELQNVRLTAVKNAKILGTAEPGEELLISVELQGRMGNLAQITGSVSSDKQLLASAIVTLSGDR